MFIRSKVFLFLALFVVSATLFLFCFPNILPVALAKWRIQTIFKKGFDAPFTYDSLEYSKGCFHLKGGGLIQGSSRLTVEEVVFSMRLDLDKRELKGALEIEALQLTECDEALLTEGILKSFSIPKLPFFTSSVSVNIREGSLLMDKKPEETTIGFALSGERTCDRLEGICILNLGQNLPEVVATVCEQAGEPMHLAAVFSHHRLPPLAQAFRFCLTPFLSKWHQSWEITDGFVDGSINLVIDRGYVSSIDAKLQIDECLATNATLELKAAFESVFADLKLTDQIPDGTFAIRNGSFTMDGAHRKKWHKMWDLNHLNADIALREGKVESSSIGASFLGMNGQIDLDWLSSNETLAQMAFLGNAEQIVSFLPNALQSSWQEAFQDDLFSLTLSLKRADEGLEVVGALQHQSDTHPANHMTFGCQLGGHPEPIQAFVDEKKEAFSEPIVSFVDSLKEQFYLSHPCKGWFRAQKVALATFVAPFLFNEINIDLSGNFDFEGVFDERSLIVFYGGENLKIESPHFCIDAESVGASGENAVLPVHYFNLETKEHTGFLPLQSATYRQKNHQLDFSEMSALISFKDHEIHIDKLKAHYENLLFDASVAITLLGPKQVDLQLTLPRVLGSATSARSFLSHLNDLPLWKLPLEGDFVSERAFFHFDFAPKATLVDGCVAGSFLIKSSSDLSSFALSSSFEWDCLTKRFAFHSSHGNVEIQEREYPIAFDEASVVVGRAGEATILDVHLPSCDFLDHQLGPFNCVTKMEESSCQVLQMNVQGEDLVVSGHQPIELCLTRGIGFSIPKVCLQDLLSSLSSLFHGAISVDLCEKIAALRPERGLRGDLLISSGLAPTLCLEEGVYSLFGHSLYLKQIQVCHHDSLLELQCSIADAKKPLTLSLCYHTDHKQTLLVTLSQPNEPQEGLVFQWQRDDLQKWRLHSLQGSLYGLSARLEMEDHKRGDGHISVVGSLGLDSGEIFPLLPSQLASSLTTLKLGAGFRLNGHFLAEKEALTAIRFEGKLVGSTCSILGTTFSELASEVSYRPGVLEFKNLELRDRALSLLASELTFIQGETAWCVKAPHVHARKIRPCLLDTELFELAIRKKKNLGTLVIHSCELSHFQGSLDDPKSYSGSGSLQFTNYPKSGLISNILLIPADIIARIGLDLTLLVPVRGVVDYELGDGKVWITDFHDMFSQGRRSRFFLAKENPSFVTFDGALNLDVRMKQYNLLMKIIELFTLNVRGNLAKPTYQFTPNGAQ